jgi:hypothetical protein
LEKHNSEMQRNKKLFLGLLKPNEGIKVAASKIASFPGPLASALPQQCWACV